MTALYLVGGRSGAPICGKIVAVMPRAVCTSRGRANRLRRLTAVTLPPFGNVPGVYAIEHTATGRLYVGSSVCLRRRIRDHLRTLGTGRHHCRHLQAAWTKYGAVAFTFRVLEVCDREVLLRREQHYLDTLSPALNIRVLAHSNLGVKHSVETRAKMSAWQIGRVFSAETRARIGAAHAGKVMSPESRAKMSAARKGKSRHPTPDAVRAKISAALKGQMGRSHSDETKAKLSAAKQGHLVSDGTRAKISAAKSGRLLSAEHRAKIAEAGRGRRHSDETKVKMSESAKRRWAMGAHMRPESSS